MSQAAELELARRVQTIAETRAAAADALCRVLAARAEAASEESLRDGWIHELVGHASVYSGGWYQPPPSGACVLIGRPDDGFRRLAYRSLRSRAAWSRADIFLDRDSLLYAYASPVHSGSAMIGDIGTMLYRGSDKRITEHLEVCVTVTRRTAEFASVGMELRELFWYADQIATSYGLRNVARSGGVRNIGHTVPYSYGAYPENVPILIAAGAEREVCEAIRGSRVGITGHQRFVVPETIALTIEPQLVGSGLPQCSFHVIVVFTTGRKSVVTCFRGLFRQFGMEDLEQQQYDGDASGSSDPSGERQ